MNSIKELVFKNFNLVEKEKTLIDNICNGNQQNKDRALFVCKNLIERRLDFNTIVAYLCVECGFDITKTEDVDSDIWFLFNGLNAENKIETSEENNAEEIRKMFIATAGDVRIIIAKLYIMLFEINQFELPLKKKDHSTLLNVREIFAPLAERLGLNSLKANLEDCCLKLLNRKVYKYLEESVETHKENNNAQIEITRSKLENIILELGYKNATISSRQKHYSSIFKKIQKNGVTLASLYDLVALRVIVDTVEECYSVLGKIHAIYKPMAGRFKDYIASPKPNGYQSLHTTIIADNERPLEIQIRTHNMHKMAEFGVFAHWLYKEKKNKMTALDKKFSWLREIMETSKDVSNDEFVDTLKTNLCEGQIFVQTPKGKILEFVEGSTVLDFAFAIHSDVGIACVGAKVNGKIKPISSKIATGDIVEILTSQTNKKPSKDWLKIVKSNSAKNKINSYFKQEMREENIKTGQNMVANYLKAKGYTPNKVMVDKYLCVENFKHVYKNILDMFAEIGYGSISASTISNRLIQLYDADNTEEVVEKIESIKNSNSVHIKRNKDGILIDGDSGMMIRYAGCCTPVFGENIVGYVSRGRGVTIHKESCVNLKYLEQERLIKAVWDEGVKNRTSNILLKIISQKNDTFLANLTQTLISAKIKILGLDSKRNKDGKIITILKIEVLNTADIKKAVAILKDIKSVEDVFRVGG